MQVSADEWRRALDMFVKQERVSIDSRGVIHIINWAKYQSEYARVVKYRREKPESEKTLSDQKRGDQIREDTRKVTPPGVTSAKTIPPPLKGAHGAVASSAAHGIEFGTIDASGDKGDLGETPNGMPVVEPE